MHGVKRKGRTQDEAKRKAERERIEAYTNLSKQVLEMVLYLALLAHYYQRNNPDTPPFDALAATEKLLSLVCEYYTAWAYRRDIFISMSNTEADMPLLYKSELKLCQKMLQENPKSYWVWHHRKWITSNASNLGMGTCDWDKELQLCGMVLHPRRREEGDDRNFHCWSYRRFVANMKANQDHAANIEPHDGHDWLSEIHSLGLDEQGKVDEVDFSRQCINVNFSNYSAWHQRSKLLSFSTAETLDSELNLLRNAFYTEPADQSAWFYHRHILSSKLLSVAVIGDEDVWQVRAVFSDPVPELKMAVVCDGTVANGTWESETDHIWIFTPDSSVSKPSDVVIDDIVTDTVLKSELSMCEELLEVEPDAVWPMLTKIFILLKLEGDYSAQIPRIVDRLCELDPDRQGYYRTIK